jgi:hypothetical protein
MIITIGSKALNRSWAARNGSGAQFWSAAAPSTALLMKAIPVNFRDILENGLQKYM